MSAPAKIQSVAARFASMAEPVERETRSSPVVLGTLPLWFSIGSIILALFLRQIKDHSGKEGTQDPLAEILLIGAGHTSMPHCSIGSRIL